MHLIPCEEERKRGVDMKRGHSEAPRHSEARSAGGHELAAMATLSLSSVFTGLSLSSSAASSLFAGDSRLPSAADASASLPCSPGLVIEAAHKKGSGSTKNGRDSNPKMLGVKIYGDQVAKPGAIIVRQRGTKVTSLQFLHCAS